MRQIMRSSLDYAGFAQLCGKPPIMCKIMRVHNRIIPRSLPLANKKEKECSLLISLSQVIKPIGGSKSTVTAPWQVLIYHHPESKKINWPNGKMAYHWTVNHLNANQAWQTIILFLWSMPLLLSQAFSANYPLEWLSVPIIWVDMITALHSATPLRPTNKCPLLY